MNFFIQEVDAPQTQWNTQYEDELQDLSHPDLSHRNHSEYPTWQEKDRIRHTYQTRNAPFTWIERAFMASAISVNTSTEMDQDEMKAKLAAADLESELVNIDVNEQLKEQQMKIDLLLKELEEFRKDRQPSIESVTNHHSTPVTEPPKLINTAISSSVLAPATLAHGEISYTMSAMLDQYDMLDEDCKNELFRYAISTGNENLQNRLLIL
jgi:hypothetical protein